MVNSGRSLYEVQHLLGHARPVTTQRYSHLTRETLLDATNQAADSLGGMFANAPANPVIADDYAEAR